MTTKTGLGSVRVVERGAALFLILLLFVAGLAAANTIFFRASDSIEFDLADTLALNITKNQDVKIPNGNLNMSGNTIQNFELSCQSGMSSVSGGRLCITDGLEGNNDWHSAQTDCMDTYGGHICKATELMEACSQGVIPDFQTTDGLLGDKVTDPASNGDDEYGTINQEPCNSNIDGASEDKPIGDYWCCYG